MTYVGFEVYIKAYHNLMKKFTLSWCVHQAETNAQQSLNKPSLHVDDYVHFFCLFLGAGSTTWYF